MIKQTRVHLAREQVKEFIDKMERLGFNRGEVLRLLEQEEGHE